jgi:GAF domain
VSVRHKAQVLQYTCAVLEGIAARERSLCARLTLSTPERLDAWVRDVAASHATVGDALQRVLRLIMCRTDWPLGDVWMPSLPMSAAASTATDHPVPPLRLLQIPDAAPAPALPALELAGAVVQDDKPPSHPLRAFARSSADISFFPPAGVPGRVFATRQPEWLARVSDEAIFLRARVARETGVLTCFALPVTARGRVIAVVAVYDTKPRAYSTEVVDLSQDIVRAVGIALDSMAMPGGV